ncbi:Uncharacterised protein [Mycobacteroides abscessus subsp. massiliense]|nr:Uncharacterised protein [Mycobacteroides abscessus subsp. massiliense]
MLYGLEVQEHSEDKRTGNQYPDVIGNRNIPQVDHSGAGRHMGAYTVPHSLLLVG